MARRTRKNKRKTGNGVQLHAPMIAVLALAATVFISYLWLCGRCENLGSRIKELESEYEQLHVRVLTEKSKWERMKSPARIRLFLAKHKLDMAWPDESHIVRIPMSARRTFDPGGAMETYELARSKADEL